LWQQAIDDEGVSLAAEPVRPPGSDRKQTDHSRPRQHAAVRCWFRLFRGAVIRGKKKGAPACAGAPQRSGHCRVCAQTV